MMNAWLKKAAPPAAASSSKPKKAAAAAAASTSDDDDEDGDVDMADGEAPSMERLRAPTKQTGHFVSEESVPWVER